MFTLKILNGPQAGKTISLTKEKYTLGRSKKADIIIESSQVSKQHAQINIKNNKIFIKDLDSRNGTYINGVQIREDIINSNDKITLHDIVLVISKENSNQNPRQGFQQNGNLALKNEPHMHNQSASDFQMSPHIEAEPETEKKIDKKDYLENVILPGIYKLTEFTEFNWLIGGFLTVLIIICTILSAIPATNLLKSSIEKESQRRALTITKNMVAINKNYVLQNYHSSINIDSARQEAGVINALIIDKNGSIIAPSSKAGKHPNVPFLHSARKENKVAVEQITSDEIGVLIPIVGYNKATGEQSTVGFAFLHYDMSSIAINSSRTLSLYIQIFFISLIIGAVFYFFIFKLFEFPFRKINNQLDQALKSENNDINLKFDNIYVQKLISNINTALTRNDSDQNSMNMMMSQDRSSEMTGIVQMIGFAALAFDKNLILTALNTGAEELLAFNYDMIGFGTEKIDDQALKLNLEDLIQQAQMNQHMTVTSQLDIGGDSYELLAKSIMGADDISYYIVSIIPNEEDS